MYTCKEYLCFIFKITALWWVSTGWVRKVYSVSSMRLRTVFNSFNSIFTSVFPILIWWFVSVGTPSTSSFFSLNVIHAQSMASLGTSYVISISSLTRNKVVSIRINWFEMHWIQLKYLFFCFKLPVKLCFVKYSWILSLCSLNTRQIAAECSAGRPSCCNSVENVDSLVSNRAAFTNKNRIQAMADLTDFKSFLFVANELFNFASCEYHMN